MAIGWGDPWVRDGMAEGERFVPLAFDPPRPFPPSLVHKVAVGPEYLRGIGERWWRICPGTDWESRLFGSKDEAKAAARGHAAAPCSYLNTRGERARRSRRGGRTGEAGWPNLLVEGKEGAGKTHGCLRLSADPKVGTTYVVEVGERRADEYAALGEFEIVEHDGSLRAITDAIGEVLVLLDGGTAERADRRLRYRPVGSREAQGRGDRQVVTRGNPEVGGGP